MLFEDKPITIRHLLPNGPPANDGLRRLSYASSMKRAAWHKNDEFPEIRFPTLFHSFNRQTGKTQAKAIMKGLGVAANVISVVSLSGKVKTLRLQYFKKSPAPDQISSASTPRPDILEVLFGLRGA